MKKIKDALIKFMAGRYGPDAFYKFLIAVYIILILLNLFIRNAIVYYLSIVVIIYSLFRFFSKNVYKRQQENIKYWTIREKVRKFFNLQKNKIKYRKTHVYRKCPKCGVVLRLPKKQGSHVCCCPKCKNNFNIIVR